MCSDLIDLAAATKVESKPSLGRSQKRASPVSAESTSSLPWTLLVLIGPKRLKKRAGELSGVCHKNGTKSESRIHLCLLCTDLNSVVYLGRDSTM